MRLSPRLAVLLALALVSAPIVASAATFTVNSTGNEPDAVTNGICSTAGGECTLTAAIQEANATAALDTIDFAIGSGPRTIAVPTGLPTITQPVVIDGTTQPGFSGQPLIEIAGSITAGDGLKITGGGSTLRGLVINRFSGHAVYFAVNGNNVVEGCYIGTNIAGTEIRRTLGAGIRIDSHQNRIGGTTLAQRNIISGNGGLGLEGGVMIYGESAIGNIVQGNFIGLDVTGMVPLGNLGRGVAIHYASYNLIGGPEPGAGNLISGNRASGVRIMPESVRNVVMKNWIGINKQGKTMWGKYPEPGVLGNARGVQIRGDYNYVVENVIAGNTYDGVLFYDGTGKDIVPAGFPTNNVVERNHIFQHGLNGIGAYVGEKNQFVDNAIFANRYLGINLETRTFGLVTLNDADDSDEGTNGLQNFPVLTSAVPAGIQTNVSGTLTSRPDGVYTLEFYANFTCHPLGHGEGLVSLAQHQVTTDASGVASFAVALPFALPRGLFITATATSPDMSTSEFSACRIVQ